MKRKTPTKDFVSQLDKVKQGLPFRIFRQRKNLTGAVIDEVCTHTGWKRMKTGYSKVGIFVYSQAAVRADKKLFKAAYLVKKKRHFKLDR